jgi:hypothetical protein
MFSLVKRERARFYIFLTVAAFAISVLGLRIYLYAFDYPQIGNGLLHIDHMLFGGIMLATGAFFLIIFSNTKIYSLSAILVGIGLGFFVDELGKLVSRSNDYFFRPAAPLIYLIFLLVTLVYIYIKRPRKPTDRELFYYVLDDFKEVLDGDLDINEKQHIVRRLQHIIVSTTNRDLKQFAQVLLRYTDPLSARHVDISIWHRYWHIFVTKVKSYRRVHKILLFVLILLLVSRSLQSTINLFIAWAYLLGIEPIKSQLTLSFIEQQLVPHSIDINLIIAQTIVEGIIGVLLLTGVVLRLRRKRSGTRLLKLALILSLATGDVLGFYFNQFRQAFSVFWDIFIYTYISFYEKVFSRSK